jgi:hypothetical protein
MRVAAYFRLRDLLTRDGLYIAANLLFVQNDDRLNIQIMAATSGSLGELLPLSLTPGSWTTPEVSRAGSHRGMPVRYRGSGRMACTRAATPPRIAVSGCRRLCRCPSVTCRPLYPGSRLAARR